MGKSFFGSASNWGIHRPLDFLAVVTRTSQRSTFYPVTIHQNKPRITLTSHRWSLVLIKDNLFRVKYGSQLQSTRFSNQIWSVTLFGELFQTIYFVGLSMFSGKTEYTSTVQNIQGEVSRLTVYDFCPNLKNIIIIWSYREYWGEEWISSLFIPCRHLVVRNNISTQIYLFPNHFFKCNLSHLKRRPFLVIFSYSPNS